MRNHRSGPEPSPCPLLAKASGLKILRNLIVGCNGSEWLLQDTLIGLQDYWRQLSDNSSIAARRTANPTSLLCDVVGSASLLSATAIFGRLAIATWSSSAPQIRHAWSAPLSAGNRTWDIRMWQVLYSRAATPCPHIGTAAWCGLKVRGLHGPNLQKAGHVFTKPSGRLNLGYVPLLELSTGIVRDWETFWRTAVKLVELLNPAASKLSC